MSIRPIYLKEDVTGLLNDNYIQGELHSPAPGASRLIIPKWGAFYKDSLVVFDDATGQEVDKSLIRMGDAFPYGNQKSGKDIYTCFALSADAPLTVSITYQGYGGPQSRNAHEIIKWLNERMATSPGSIKYQDLQDLPKAWNPVWHNHLLAHVYGMEYLVDSINRLSSLIGNDRHEVLEQQYQRAKVRLGQMESSANLTAEAIVEQAWRDFEEEMSLFNLGVDLLRNYPGLGSTGVLVAKPDFALENEEDDRYVDLRGLGSFDKGLVERVVLVQTNLGLAASVERESQRGSFVGALIGETFTLPSPATAKKSMYTKAEVYPSDFPSDSQMVVIKVAANNNNLGGVFSAFSLATGDQWVGLLFNDSWKNPLIWRRVYFDDMVTSIKQAIEEHAKATGAVHSETKEQLGLGLVENLPVLTEDELLVEEYPRKLITYDVLLAYWRLKQEGIKLKRKENGEVDFTPEDISKLRIVINTGACGPLVPPKDQFISHFCNGSDKWVRLTDGNNSYYDKIVEQKSIDCNYVDKIEYGKKLSEFCQGTSMMGRYSDGLGGSTVEVIRVNSTDCGYVAPPVMGSVLAVFCQDVNQVTRYADGKGATYDMVSMVDTYICGGKIYASTGTGNGGGTVVDPKIIFKSTHSKLTAGTTEIISFYATKFATNSRYVFEVLQSDSAGTQTTIVSGTFITDGKGSFLWEQTRLDDGKSTPRGIYENWIRVTSENIESNKITRNFIAGTTATDPDDTGNAGGGDAGGGNTGETAEPPKNVNGDPYGSDKTWPPLPVYAPALSLATDKPTLFVGSNETMTVSITSFLADTDVEISFWTQHPKITNGAPFKTLTVKVRTDARGMATYRVSNYDDGTIPRGTTTDWIEGKTDTGSTVKSNTIQRVWSEGTEGIAKWRQLTVTSSHSQVNIGTTYTQSVVLTGALPNTQYFLELRRSQYSGTVAENGILIATFSVTTNGSGVARYDYTDRYDGIMPPPRIYMFYARLTGIDQMSTISTVTFVDKPADQTGRGILTFNTSQPNIKKGVTETLTATITNGNPDRTVTIEHWNQSSALNGGQPLMSATSSMRIGSNGIGVSEVTVTDDGTTPRGTYQSWVECSSEYLISRKITRTFLNDNGQPVTDAPTALKVSYTTSTNTVSPGTTERHTIEVTDGPRNGVVFADLYISSPALNNGNTPLKTTTRTISTNSQGYGKDEFDTIDNGNAPPRGTYVCWVTVNNVQSPTWTRTFIGTPPPTVTYNPKLVYTVNSQTVSIGQTDTSTITLSGFRPFSSYSVEFWLKGAGLFNGNENNILTKVVTTDANGNAQTSTSAVDIGVTPRGTYNNWGRVAETGTISNTITRTFIGTTAPEPPAYNPGVRYYTNRGQISVGTSEQHTIALSGFRPNTSYEVAIYIQSPALFNGAVYNSTSKRITTDAVGSGSIVWTETDAGGVPRGPYANWAVEVTTSTRSSTFTRVFV